jgi:hypothetical protein
MDVVAQRVRTTWTKRSRGGPAASVRNRVPVTFPRPDSSPTVRVEPAPTSRPQRDGRPAPVSLRPGEWLRWQINYRFGSMCECGAHGGTGWRR